MSLQIDEILDRRKLRKKVSFWRVVTFLLAVGFVLGLFSMIFKNGDWLNKTGDHIARIEISGLIMQDKALIAMLKQLEEDDNVKGVLVAMDSPGGTVVGGEMIYEALRNVAKKKPVATSVGNLAASAGYMIASATDHIVAHRTSMVGSIGVLFQYPTIGGLLDKIGVKYEVIKSAPLKAEPSMFHDTKPEVREAIQALIEDDYNWFVDLVTERRPFDRATTLKLADGRVFTGNQGVQNKLIDAIGGEEVALKWLHEQEAIAKDLEIIDWKKRQEKEGMFGIPGTLARLAGIFNIPLKDAELQYLSDQIPEQLLQNGMLAIWHPNN